LNTGQVCGGPHLAAEGVDLLNELPLGQAPDGGVTAHTSDSIFAHGDHGGAASHAGAGQGGLDTGVPPADYDDIEIGCHFRFRLGYRFHICGNMQI
jgi:hypothetical protein